VESRLLRIINTVINKKGKEISSINCDISLRNDLGMDSLDLAELTVRIEDEFDVDIFEDGVIDKISEILNIISR